MFYFLFVVGFVLLIKGADLLVDGSTSVAKRYNVSNIVIGLTIVAFGTSLPELVVNLFASFENKADIAIGNILGSNIANILLILGVSAMIYPLSAQKNTVIKEIPFSLLAAIVMGFMANDILIDGALNSNLSRIDGLVLIGFFSVFMYYIFGIAKADDSLVNSDEYKTMPLVKSLIFIVLGIGGLVVGGKWIVDGAVVIAQGFGISESLIGLTVVAIGTSLPELATSAIAAYKKQSDIAIGNVVGSNIFNIFWVLGLSSIIRPLPFMANSNKDILMVIISSLIMFFVMFVGKKHVIEKWQGGVLFILYVTYIVFSVINH